MVLEWWRKKSQASLEQLMKIVGHPQFRPEDVAGNNWRLVNAQLSGERNEGLNEDDWEVGNDTGQPNPTGSQVRVSFGSGAGHGESTHDPGPTHLKGNNQRRPTKANTGQRRPTAANEGQCRPTKTKKG